MVTINPPQAGAPRSFIASLFFGAWGAFNTLRRIVFGIIALIIVSIVLAAIFSAGGKSLGAKTALVIPFKGMVVEQFSGSAEDLALQKALGDGPTETRLRDIKQALEWAAKDKNIDRVVLRLDDLAGAGQVSLREIQRYVSDFKKASNKEVLAYAYGYDQKGLFIAATADKVYMHPEGAALIEGLGRFRTYYKTALEKLGVKMNIFRVGKFKSAVEPYFRDEPSAEAREMDGFWLGDVWERYLTDYAAMRKTTPAALKAMIDELPQRMDAVGGNLATLALQEKLVDELKTEDEMRDMLIKKGARAKDRDDPNSVDFAQVSMESYLSQQRLLNPANTSKNAVAVIVAEGGISDGKQPQGSIGGESTAALVRQAREDSKVKALVLRVDSPGGSGFASEVIRREIELTKAAGKPVFISMGNIAASGGYWISMTSDAIYASPSTITGSIGIFGLFPSADQALDKIGVHTGGTTTTWLAGALDPTRALDPRAAKVFQAAIENGYQKFVSKVASSRKQTFEQINEIAQGRVWTGAQAKERGLVDQFGLLDDVIKAAAAKANLSDYRVSYIEEKPSGFAALLAGMGNAVIRSGVKLVGAQATLQSLAPTVVTRAQLDAKFLSDATSRPFSSYAHCLCEIE
jgi:protease IV